MEKTNTTTELYRYAVRADGKSFVENAPSKWLLEQELKKDFQSFQIAGMGSDETLTHAVVRLGW